MRTHGSRICAAMIDYQRGKMDALKDIEVLILSVGQNGHSAVACLNNGINVKAAIEESRQLG